MKALTTFFKKLTFGKKLLLLIAPIITVIVSMEQALIGLAFLIFIDLLTGIRRTHHEWKVTFQPRKKKYWLSIRSYLLRQTWRKTYEYGIGIIVIIIFEQLIFGQQSIEIMDKSFSIAELAVVFPAIVEIWSIFENFEAVSNVNLLKRVQSFLPPWISALTKENKKNVITKNNKNTN